MRRALLLLIFASPLLADDTDVRHVRLDIDVDPVGQTVSGTCTTTVRCETGGLTSFTLKLHRNFAVTAVTLNGGPATYTRPTDEVAVTLDRPYNQGETFTVAVTYAGTPANLGFGSFTFRTHGTPPQPIVSSLSETDFAYTWWPCKLGNTDKFTAEMWVTVPDGLIVASNGALQGTDPMPGSRTRFRWTTQYPIMTYGVSVAISNYQVRTDTYTHMGANMPVEHYAYPESFAGQQSGMNRIVGMLTVFSNLCGQYPFVNEKYGIAQFSWGGGMEHQTITSQSSWSENLSAHELGHSWWGNMITCATWHDIWVNEGFATYMEALWDENKPGGGVAAYFSRMNSNKPTNPTGSGSVYVYDIGNMNNIFSTNNVYRKGAWVLHQLRHIVGDTTLFQILRDFRAAKEFGSATTDEFRAIASTTAGQDLTWFFDQCVMRAGAPAYSLAWSPQTIGGQAVVLLSVGQTQSAAAWRFPIDIQVTTGSGNATSVVWNDQKRDDYVLPANGTASAVSLDPSSWILRGTTTTAAYAPSLAASPGSVPSTGGPVSLALAAGTHHAGRGYAVLGSVSGILPGLALPGSKVLPVNLDGFTIAALLNANGPNFQNFLGTLNVSGGAGATLVVPNLGPLGTGIALGFAFGTITAPWFTSNPVVVTIGP